MKFETTPAFDGDYRRLQPEHRTAFRAVIKEKFGPACGIPGHVNTYAVIPIGWPKGKFGAVSRRPVAESIHWQRW